MSTKHIPHSHTSKEKQKPLVVATPIAKATEKELEHVQPEAAPVAKDAPPPEGEPVKSGDFSNEETIRANIASGVNDTKAPDVSTGELLGIGHQIEEQTEKLRDKLALVSQAVRLELGPRYDVLKRLAGITDRSLAGSQAAQIDPKVD